MCIEKKTVFSALAVCMAGLVGAPGTLWAASLIPAASFYVDQADVKLRAPESVACDSRGGVVVSDTGNKRLVRFSYDGERLSGGVVVAVPEVPYPGRVQIRSDGTLVVLDRRSRRLVSLGEGDRFESFVVLEGATKPSKVIPYSFRIDANDSLYVLDIGARRVLVAKGKGAVVREIRFPSHGEGQTAVPNVRLTDLAVDGRGNVYVLDSVGARLFVARAGEQHFSPLGESFGAYASFPLALAVDRQSSAIWVVDQNGGGLVGVGPDGSYLGRQLSKGRAEGLLFYPAAACTSRPAGMVVADRGNNRVQLFTLSR